MAVTDAKSALVRHELPEADLSHKREVARRLDAVVKRGNVEWVGEFTLSTGTTSTTVVDERVTTDCQISLMPLTPEAAALLPVIWIEKATLTPGVEWTATKIGTFVVKHPSLLSNVVAMLRSSCKG